MAVCLVQNGDHVGHVGREGTQVLLNALLVSDIGKYFLKNSQFRTVKGRNVQARLSHQGKQTDGFNRNGLTAGVRSCHNQQIEIFS